MTGKVLSILFLLLCAGLLVILNGSASTARAVTTANPTTVEKTGFAATASPQTAVPFPTASEIGIPEQFSATSIRIALPTATWAWHPPGAVQTPVLLYHHVSDEKDSRYYVSRRSFEAQMAHLQRAGYTAIPISRLVQALLYGADLPRKPVAITFDDGYRDVYENALPVMQRYNSVGTVYIITDQVGVKSYMKMEHLRSLVESGWEIGSHSRSHTNLRLPGVRLISELEGSRQLLEEKLGIPVVTFSYPYGLSNHYVTGLVKEAGYLAAVGLGQSLLHTENTRYYLSRIEIQGGSDLVEFARLVAGPGAGSLSAPQDFSPDP